MIDYDEFDPDVSAPTQSEANRATDRQTGREMTRYKMSQVCAKIRAIEKLNKISLMHNCRNNTAKIRNKFRTPVTRNAEMFPVRGFRFSMSYRSLSRRVFAVGVGYSLSMSLRPFCRPGA
jgi:hypothetical protein